MESTVHEVSDEVSEVVHALEQAWVLTTRHVGDLPGVGLTAALTLRRLDRLGPARLTAIATAEGVSQPAMSQVVARLERAGLTTRVSDPGDGRAALIDITDAGREQRRRWSQLRRDRLERLLAGRPEADVATLTLALRVALPIIERLIDQSGETLPG